MAPVILHIDTEKGFRGGEQQVLSLMRGLRGRGFEQVLATRRADSGIADRAEAEGFAVERIKSVSTLNIFTRMTLRSIAESRGVGLVHAHTGNAHTLAWQTFGDSLPVVVTRRVDFSVKDNPLSRAKYTDGKVTFIAISSGVRDVLIEGGVPPEHTHIVPSGVDPERFAGAEGGEKLRMEWHAAPGDPVVGTVGSYVDHKDPLNLIEAAAIVSQQLPAARFVFVGEGELRPQMEERADRLGIASRVILTGWREEVGAFLSAMDMFVMPSKLEGLCTSLLDAQAVGLPCIGTRTGGIPDIITDSENGLLVPPQNPQALADAILRLWEDKEAREDFQQRGPQVVRERFTVETMVEGTAAVYEEVLRHTP